MAALLLANSRLWFGGCRKCGGPLHLDPYDRWDMKEIGVIGDAACLTCGERYLLAADPMAMGGGMKLVV